MTAPALALAVLVALAGAPAAWAGTVTVAGTLEADASATDYFKVTCSDDGSGAPASLVARVRDDLPSAAPMISVQIQRATSATNSTDAVDGDATPSPLISVDGAAGVFDVFVDKSAAGAESYTVEFTCMTDDGGGGVPTGTAFTGTETAAAVPALSAFGALVLFVGLVGAAAFGRGRRVGPVLMVLALGHAGNVAAHSDSEDLGTAASATDYWEVTCSDDGPGPPASLVLRVTDTGSVASPQVSAQIHKGQLLVNVTDPADDGSNPSPFVYLNGGAGVYEVLVDKTAAGEESYLLEFHCQTGPNGTGIHTGTDYSLYQDQ
jgi:hypothetical protein